MTESDWNEIKNKFQHLYDKYTFLENECLLWTKTKPYRMGRAKKYYLTIMIERKVIDVRKASVWLTKGYSDFNHAWCSCGVNNCVNPKHIILTNNIHIGNRKTHCIRGHDLTDQNNILIIKKRLKTGEQYFKTRCRICASRFAHGKEPILNNTRINLDNFHVGYDKTKCKNGHTFSHQRYERGVNRNICKICKAESMRRRRIERKMEKLK